MIERGPVMPPSKPVPGKVDPLLEALLDVCAETKTLVNALSRAEEVLSRFELALIKALPLCAAGEERMALLVLLAKLGKDITAHGKRVTSREKFSVITSMNIEMQAGGAGLVTFNGTVPIKLAPKRAVLLKILAEVAERAADGLPAFRNRDFVRTALDQRVHLLPRPQKDQSTTTRALAVLLSRLDGQLRRSGFDALETRKGQGIRLRLAVEQPKSNSGDT